LDVENLELELLELLLEADGVLDPCRGLGNQTEDASGARVVGFLGVRRGAEGILGGLAAKVAVTPIPADVVNGRRRLIHIAFTSGRITAGIRCFPSKVGDLDTPEPLDLDGNKKTTQIITAYPTSATDLLCGEVQLHNEVHA
jgi:hypothetical protein